MDLYRVLQGILDRIRENNQEAKYGRPREQLRKVLDNQERLAEAALVLGGMLQALTEREINIQLRPREGEDKH